MAFVNETISEADQNKFNAYNFKSPLTNKPVEAWKWTIDRERNIFLTSLGGQGLRLGEIPKFFVLIWRDNVIRIEAYSEGTGNYQFGIELWWDITKISIPEHLKPDQELITELVKESLDAYGAYYDRDHVKRVNFNYIAPPVFVPEV